MPANENETLFSHLYQEQAYLLMQIPQLIQTYLRGLEEGDASGIISLFSSDGVVHSPLYGQQAAGDFYHKLFQDTRQSAITLLHIFQETQQADVAAAHFRYDWLMKDGTPCSFECVDVFYLDPEGKIREMHIIYDTQATRTAFAKLQ